MEHYDAKATFFIDYLMLIKMKTESVETKLNYERILDQLHKIIRLGHRIELHLHPHWLDAKLVNGKWDFSEMKRYRLHSLTEFEIIALFKEGKQVLETIARSVINDYTIKCFRAGGWCIQPFCQLEAAFRSADIFIDSSVSFGAVSNSKNLKFDFTNAPNKEMYHFSNKVDVEDVSGDFLEIPISSYNHNLFHRIVNRLDKIIYQSRYKKFGDGCHHGFGADNTVQKKKIFVSEKRMLSIDGVCPKILTSQLKESRKNKLVLISHPKDISTRSLDTLKRLCKSNKFKLSSLE